MDYLLWETNDRTSFWNDTAGFGNMSLSTEVMENTDDGVIYQQNFDDIANGELPEGFTPAEGQEAGWSVQDGKLVADFSRSGEIERRIALWTSPLRTRSIRAVGFPPSTAPRRTTALDTTISQTA